MVGKTTTNEMQSALKKERFEFVLTINDYIVCQRYFRINGFRNRSLCSMELVNAIDKCVEMINEDLIDKTKIYHEYAAPQVFDNIEQMKKWLDTPSDKTFSISPNTFVIFRESDDVYVWDGQEMTPYTKYYNKADFICDSNEDGSSVLKFTFIDNGPDYMTNEEHREVCSKIWDASVYPRFIRSNIDLSNSRNKFRGGDVFAPIELAVTDKFIELKTDLVPLIVKEICNCCSNSDDDFYTTSDKYGDIEYNFDIQNANYKLMRSYERKYKKKTDEYFGKKS